MRSWQTILVNQVLKVRGSKRIFSDAARTRDHVHARHFHPDQYAPPGYISWRCDIDLRFAHGWPVYELTPKDTHPDINVVYLHGGAYVYELVSTHWAFIRALALATPARFVIPIYPLAPRNQASQIVPAAAGILADVIQSHATEKIMIMGDSAGAGMALAACQELCKQGRKQPDKMLLISPWLDVGMSHPMQADIERLDPMLARPGLAEAGRLYAGELAIDHPYVSPLYGELKDLAPACMFSGTHDLLHTDAREFLAKTGAQGMRVEYHQGDELPHLYPLLPTPEGRLARKQIIASCRK